ncbi:MAG: hypothetical protein EBS84_19335, partial [Proteobacteria bacterium]|nr:hypothetical protein [Pseudomonadota bacterium]
RGNPDWTAATHGDPYYDGGYFGGDASADPAKGLREYADSLSAKAKEDVIRRLARALSLAGINVDPNGDLDEIIQQLVSQIPNPKNGKTFSSDAEAQKKVCRVIADVLNGEFSPGVTTPHKMFIDTSLDAVEMCRKVGEWAHSFSVGVNTEFLAVHASVKNALRTVEILAKIMEELYAKIQNKVQNDGDARLTREVDPLNDVYIRAQHERTRQMEVLKHILNVQLAPAAKELEIAMRDESEANAIVKKLGLKPGTSDFADSLAMAISGLGTAASIAQRVHKALKQVGVSVRQYLDSDEFADFQELLDEKIQNGSVSTDDLAKFLEAVNTLRASFGQKDNDRFRAALLETETTGGARHRRRHGGAGDDENKSSVQKRVERRETEKKVILRDFATRMARHYDELLAAVKAMGPRLGREIPLTDKTDALNDALKRLRDMRNATERIELALIGMYMEATAREHKERFVSALRLVSAACSEIISLEMYRAAMPHFTRLKAAIDSIEKTIDFFADVVTKKYGGAPFDEDDATEVYGGRAHGGAGVEDYLPEIARSGLSFGEAINEFAYYYYVAKVHTNLEQTSKELDTYGEKYVELLGDAVAQRIFTLEQARKAIFARLDPMDPGLLAMGAPGAAPFDNNDDGKARFAAAKKWVNDEYDVKAKFYKSLQAVDLYMKAFTAGITKDPDSIRDIKKMLDGTQVIARWFSEQTGDSIWQAFDLMRSSDFNAAAPAAVVNTDGDTAAVPGDHYYNKVLAVTTAARAISIGDEGRLGIPQAGVNCGAVANDNAAKAKKLVSQAIDYYQALKNLINAFARIGDKFGGRELRTQVFMSPTQVFKALTDYMKQSAMSINASSGADHTAAPVGLTLGTYESLPALPNAVTPWQVYFGSVEAAMEGNYVIEDKYFVLIIKAMAAKVLTTLGVFDMFERTTPIYNLTATRMIIGGAADDFSAPEVLEGAAELYFRLPRLAEFYREFLFWKPAANAPDAWRISMLPELEGVFSGIIRLIFQKAVSPDTGDYSDSEMRTLVREVNFIYEHFREKHPEGVTKAALSAFVMEVNRRYGVIKSKDMANYWAMVKLTRTGNYGQLNETNYAILPGEGEDEVDRRAPSDGYTVLGTNAAAAVTDPFKNRVGLAYPGANNIGATYKELLREFRIKFDKQFEFADTSRFGKTSYALLIKQAEREINHAQSLDDKFLVATKLIQGTNVVGTDINKSFMFHETAVVGLNLLSSFETMLRAYSASIDRMNPKNIEDAIMDAIYLNARDRVAGGGVVIAATTASIEAIMVRKYPSLVDPTNPAQTIYHRYLIPNGAGTVYAMRGNMPLNVAAASVYTFAVEEEASLRATVALPLGLERPSQVTELNPDDNALIQGNAAAVAIGRYVRALRLVARLITNYDMIMREYIEELFTIMSGAKTPDSSQSLIEVRMSPTLTSGIQLSFAKFRGLVESLLTDVKYYFELFRPSLPAATVARFENRANPGSIFWIEENLIDRFFRGTDADVNSEQTLEGLARRVSAVYRDLNRKLLVPLGNTITDADLRDVNAVNRLVAFPPGNFVDGPTLYENYGQTLSEIVFYNAVDGVSRQANVASAALANTISLSGLVQSEFVPGGVRTIRVGAGGAGGAAEHFNLYNTTRQGMTDYRSLLFAYNQLVARYLTTISDKAGGTRVYLNLINAFANGAASRSVSAPATSSYPDLVGAAEPFGFRGDPLPTAVLCQSLAYSFQRVLKDVNQNNQIPTYLVNTLSDVPLYMKEALRADLPAYIKYFDALVMKGDFIKQLMQKTSIRLDRPSQQAVSAAGANIKIRSGVNDRAVAAVQYPPNALEALEDLDAGKNSEQMKAKLASIIDAIASGAVTLSNSAAETLKELGDTPVYFQTQEGSIEQYRIRYGKMPLMPLSMALYPLNDLTPPVGPATLTNDTTLFPGHTLGTESFKFVYGTRQLIMRSSPVGFEQVPGVKDQLEAYNGVSPGREQIDANRHLSFVQNVVNTLRFITEMRNVKVALSIMPDLFPTTSLIRGAGPLTAGNGIVEYNVAAGVVTGNAAYPINRIQDLQKVLEIIESSNQEEGVRRLADRVGGDSGRGGLVGSGRAEERILNIVDMNIIPINVHALMRNIPLANLYNYEYTFEQMVASMYGEQATRYTSTPGAPGAITNATTLNTREMFLRLLVDPYLELDTNMYGSDVRDTGSTGYVHRIFRGDNNLGMGRPKFLSDQLFNKVLFGSVYQSRRDFDEGGPTVGIGAARGQGVASNPTDSVNRCIREIYRIRGVIAEMRANFLIAVNNRAGLRIETARMRAAGVAAAVIDALRDGVHREVYATGIAGLPYPATINTWAPLLNQYLPQLPPTLQVILQNIVALLVGTAGRAFGGAITPHNLVDLGEQLDELSGPGVAANTGAGRTAAMANPNFDAHMDALLLLEFNPATGGSITQLFDNTLNPANPGGFAHFLANNTRRPANATPAVGPAYLPLTNRSVKLTYLKLPDDADPANASTAVSEVSLNVPETKARLEAIGKKRFDTRFIRNIFFITNVVRILRLKLNRELSQSRNVLVASHASVSAGVTEYGSDPFGSNEILSSGLNNGVSRFNDADDFV